MAYKHSGVSKILKFEIPVPSDPAEEAAYIALGWYRLRGLFGEPDYLKWSFAKGSPRHPSDRPHN